MRLGHLLLRERALAEGFRTSLFFVPTLFVAAAAALARLLLSVDQSLSPDSLPEFLRSTVDSGRILLGTVAGATITVAGIVFSVTMVAVQLASSQFSPRVLRGFLRDRFQQLVMGYMVGTFTYCLLILGAIRALPEADGRPAATVPHLSVIAAIVLGIGAIVAILADIDHTARFLQVTEIVRRVTDETVQQIRHLLPDDDHLPDPPRPDETPPPGAHTVRARESGWVQQVNSDVLLGVLPPGATLRLEQRVGSFVTAATPLATVWPAPDDPERCDRGVHDGVVLGSVRTMQQDVSLGIRQLVDVALRALSPAVNDPTTAIEVIVHLGALLREMLAHDLRPFVRAGEDGRRVLRPCELTHAGFVDEAFDQIRHAGAQQPMVARALLDTLRMLVREAEDLGVPERAEPLRRQAVLVVAQLRAAERVLPDDVDTALRSAPPP